MMSANPSPLMSPDATLTPPVQPGKAAKLDSRVGVVRSSRAVSRGRNRGAGAVPRGCFHQSRNFIAGMSVGVSVVSVCPADPGARGRGGRRLNLLEYSDSLLPG